MVGLVQDPHSSYKREGRGNSSVQFSAVQFSCSVMSNSVIPWIEPHKASLSIINSQTLLKLKYIEMVVPSNHLILCHPLIFLPLMLPSIRVFSSESVLIRWPKYWTFSFSICLPNEYSELISFRIDWFDLLAVQRTLKSPSTPQFQSITSSALSVLCGPTLTSIYDYQKKMDYCQQSNVSAFSYAVSVDHSISSKE